MYSNTIDSLQGHRTTQKMTTYGCNKNPKWPAGQYYNPCHPHTGANERQLCHQLIEILSHGFWSMTRMANDLINVCICAHDAQTASFVSCLQNRLAHATHSTFLQYPINPIIPAISLCSHYPILMHEKATSVKNSFMQRLHTKLD